MFGVSSSNIRATLQDADRRERLGGGTRGESTALPRGNPAEFLKIIAQRPQIQRLFLRSSLIQIVDLSRSHFYFFKKGLKCDLHSM